MNTTVPGEAARRRRSLLPAVLLLAAGLWAGLAHASAQQAEFPRLEPDPRLVSLSTPTRPLDANQLSRFAMVLSGVEPAALEAEIGRVQREVARMLVDMKNAEPHELGDWILSYLHRNILREYDQRQTRLDVLMEMGTFNCVSSAVLYLIFARAAGLKVWAVRTADHAFCRVDSGGDEVDVETTTPYGYAPGTRKEFAGEFGRITGYAYVPPGNYRGRRDLTGVQLLALILYNRAASFTDAGAYAEAVPVSVDAYALLGDEESRDRLAVALSNYATLLARQGKTASALAFLKRCAGLYGFPETAELRSDLAYNRVVELVNAGRFADADAMLGTDAEHAGIKPALWNTAAEYRYLKEAIAAAASDPGAAARIALQGIRRIGRTAQLLRAYEVHSHNAAVALIRAGKRAEALRVVENALASYRKSALLREDRAQLLQTTSAASAPAGAGR